MAASDDDNDRTLVSTAANAASSSASAASEKPDDAPTMISGATAAAVTTAPQVLSAADIRPGAILGHTYEILDVIAKGGMGRVYRAKHVELGTIHAVKIILPEFARDPQVVELFRREASVLRQVRHDAVVAYDGINRDAGGFLYLVMEYVEGPSLSKVIAAGPLSERNALALLERTAAGLSAAHAKGVVHRDLSPDNIILPGGKVDGAKIIDFGIAKQTAAEAGTVIGGAFAGKLAYASPEQFGLFGGQIDGRSDVYSLGLVIANAVSAKPVDMGETLVAAMQVRQTVPNLSLIPPGLKPILTAMLTPDPAQRPADVAGLVARHRPTTAQKYGPETGRSGAGLLVAAVVGLALVAGTGGAGYYWWQSQTPSPTVSGPEPKRPEPSKPAEPPKPPEKPAEPSAQPTQPKPAEPPVLLTPSKPSSSGGSDSQPPPAPQPKPIETPKTPEPSKPAEPPLAPTKPSSGGSPDSPLPPPPTQPQPQPETPRPEPPPAPKVEPVPPKPPEPISSARPLTLAEARIAVAEAQRGLSCIGIDVSEKDRGFALSGFVGTPADAQTINDRVKRLLPAATLLQQIDVRPKPFCQALMLSRGDGSAIASDEKPSIRFNRPVYRDGDTLIVTVVVGSRGGRLSVDYYDLENNVVHMLPMPLHHDNTVAAGQVVTLGASPQTATSSQRVYTISPPFGPALIVATLTDQPLFASERAEAEPVDGYLKDLDLAFDKLRRSGSEAVAATAFFESKGP